MKADKSLDTMIKRVLGTAEGRDLLKALSDLYEEGTEYYDETNEMYFAAGRRSVIKQLRSVLTIKLHDIQTNQDPFED
jgi:hypothetical protein